MNRCALGLLLLACACGRSTTASTAGTASTPSASTPAAAASAAPVPVASSAAPASLLDKLPKPPPVATGPVKVMGYPSPLSSGMNDPAAWVGFTKDGTEYGYCAELGGRDPQLTRCETVLRDGTTKTRSSDDAKGFSAPAMKELSAWCTSSGMTALNLNGDRSKWLGKPLTGQWAFTDVTIWANPVSGDGVQINAVVKIGGAVGAEQPVYPVVLEMKPKGQGFTYHSSFTNDLALSPDGTEIGAIGHFFCSEWCDDFVVYRNGTNAFAALVYNDTGFRHHKKGEYARAAELFLEATWADPKAKLPPYNLACAWAKLGDPRAKDALAVAIERDPTVKTRAPKDTDFASVKDEAWFKSATQ